MTQQSSFSMNGFLESQPGPHCCSAYGHTLSHTLRQCFKPQISMLAFPALVPCSSSWQRTMRAAYGPAGEPLHLHYLSSSGLHLPTLICNRTCGRPVVFGQRWSSLCAFDSLLSSLSSHSVSLPSGVFSFFSLCPTSLPAKRPSLLCLRK